METTIPERLQRKLHALVHDHKKHAVRTIVPHGWQPHDLMKEVLADIAFEQGVDHQHRAATNVTDKLKVV